jgi:hypothetical protein
MVFDKTADDFSRTRQTREFSVFRFASIKLNHVPSCRQFGANDSRFGNLFSFSRRAQTQSRARCLKIAAFKRRPRK